MELIINFLINDEKSTSNERINFIEYLEGFVELYKKEGCNEDKIY